MDDMGYPVEFPEGKRAAVVLRIHETPDNVMKILKSDGRISLQRAHDYILQSRKNKKGNYIIGNLLWTPHSDCDIDSGDGEKMTTTHLKFVLYDHLG